jgi:uncharacterized protein (TIGR03067 family)
VVIIGGAAGWIFWPGGESVDITAAADNVPIIADTPQATVAANTSSDAMAPSPQLPAASGAAVNAAFSPASPPATAAVSPPEPLDGDLALLQGTWRLADVQADPNIPFPPGAVDAIKQSMLSIDGSIAIVYPKGNAAGSQPVSFELLLNPAHPFSAIEIKPMSGGIAKGFPGTGIYRLQNDQLQLCLGGEGRPAELKTDLPKKQFSATLQRIQPGELQEPLPKVLFDHKAWTKAQQQLRAKGISSELVESIPLEGGETQLAVIDLPPFVDGKVAPEVVEILSPVSHIHMRTGWKESEPKTAFTDRTLQQIAQHKGLLGLIITSPADQVTAEGLLYLKNCPDFRSLSFHAGTSVSPQLFRGIGHLQELRSLYVGEAKLSRNEISVIQQLKKLEYLGLRNTGLTDAEISMLATLPELSGLDLSQTSLTDKGLESLRGLFKLESVDLQGTKVTDKGLESLAGLTRIKQLLLQGSSVSPQGVEAFKKAHPGCKVF